ncbi:MAG: serine hydrolase domain-containing protein [Maricaulaceae bacterium]
MSRSAFAQSLDYAALDRRIKVMMDDPEMVGLSVAIVEGDEITFARGYGETLKGSGERVDAETIFRWASVSKGIAATLVYDLSEEGALTLDDPVERHAPSLKLPATDKVTRVKDIMTHRTGLPRNAYDTRIEDNWTGAKVRESLSGLKRVCDPATCHSYQNGAYDALSETVESLTQLPYKAVVNERIFEPLGMATASVTREGLVRSKNWAKPHHKNGTPQKDVLPTYYRIPAAAGVNSSVKDLARWMAAQFNGYGFMTEAQRRDMQTAYVKTPKEKRFIDRYFYVLEDPHYGYGWRIYDHAGRKLVGHRGGVAGYRALTFFDPERRAGIAVMWNTSHTRPVGLQIEFLEQLYGLERKDWLQLGERDKG